MLCSEYTLIAQAPTWGVAIPLYCRCWNCETCRPRRQAQLIELGKAGKPNRFLTLTSKRRPHLAATAAAKELALAWRRLSARIRRKLGNKPFNYLAVFEATKAGWPHLHLLLRSPYLSQAWLSQQMRELNGSPIVDIRKITNEREIARYVAKYVGKEPHKFGRLKRYWHSKNWLPAKQTQADEAEMPPWRIDEQRLDLVYMDAFREGKAPRTRPGEWVIWGEPPPHVRSWTDEPENKREQRNPWIEGALQLYPAAGQPTGMTTA